MNEASFERMVSFFTVKAEHKITVLASSLISIFVNIS
jgi:hypothetical protein